MKEILPQKNKINIIINLCIISELIFFFVFISEILLPLIFSKYNIDMTLGQVYSDSSVLLSIFDIFIKMVFCILFLVNIRLIYKSDNKNWFYISLFCLALFNFNPILSVILGFKYNGFFSLLLLIIEIIFFAFTIFYPIFLMIMCCAKKLKKNKKTLRKLNFFYSVSSFIELLILEVNQIIIFAKFCKYNNQLSAIYKITNSTIYLNQSMACVNNMIKCGVYFIYIIAWGMVLFAAITFINSFVLVKKKKAVKEGTQDTENIG